MQENQFRYASLGSGSSGNSMVLEVKSQKNRFCILYDCGFSTKEAKARLMTLGLELEQIDGIIVTHEHHDHISGVSKLARKIKCPIWMSKGTYLSTLSHKDHSCKHLDVRFIRDGMPIELGMFKVTPYTVPHDAREPLQCVFEVHGRKLGVITDVGHVTAHIRQQLQQCDALVLEFNYDHARMQSSTKYPYRLKQRITSDYGHMENEQARDLLEGLMHHELKMVHAAHISQETNAPDIVRGMLEDVCGAFQVEYYLACQNEGFDWVELIKPDAVN